MTLDSRLKTQDFYFMDTFVQQLINGLTIGSIYALIALGYTMVYGILRLINFAHGDIYMVNAMSNGNMMMNSNTTNSNSNMNSTMNANR